VIWLNLSSPPRPDLRVVFFNRCLLGKRRHELAKRFSLFDRSQEQLDMHRASRAPLDYFM
jgi:hypothetical protein